MCDLSKLLGIFKAHFSHRDLGVLQAIERCLTGVHGPVWWSTSKSLARGRAQNRGAGAVTVHSTSANGCRDLKLVGLPKGRSEDAGAWVKETDTVL